MKLFPISFSVDYKPRFCLLLGTNAINHFAVSLNCIQMYNHELWKLWLSPFDKLFIPDCSDILGACAGARDRCRGRGGACGGALATSALLGSHVLSPAFVPSIFSPSK